MMSINQPVQVIGKLPPLHGVAGRIFRKVPTRSVERHGGRVNASFFDGHVASVKNSVMGYQLLRTDAGALWARNHNGLVP